MLAQQICTGCGEFLPVTREFFGNTPSGGFRKKCRACIRAHTRAYESANPDNVRQRAETRRMRSVSAGDKYSAFEVVQLRKVQRDLCAYCCISLHGAGHVDHVTSLAKGGTNDFKNLVLACSQCNREKHAKTGHRSSTLPPRFHPSSRPQVQSNQALGSRWRDFRVV